MIKNNLGKLKRDEKGQALIFVLILLMVGGLMLGPLLSFTGSGLKIGQANEERMYELYAADAGVEEALWNLKVDGLVVPEDGQPYAIPFSPFVLNDRVVGVTITNEGGAVYKVISEAISANGNKTQIESYLTSIDFSFFLDNAITSGTSVTLHGTPPPTVIGNVEENYNDPDDWPTAAMLSAYYLQDVAGVVDPPYPDASINAKDIDNVGPLYRDGDLQILSTNDGETLTLDNTIFVTGDLTTGNNKTFTLDLNDQTIFVQGEIDLNTKCTITGSGCIIAVGDINFAPQMGSNPTDFLFIMSVEGTTKMQPQGDYYGSLAGNVDVTLQPGNSITWVDPLGEDLSFPTGDLEELDIRTWEIILL